MSSLLLNSFFLFGLRIFCLFSLVLIVFFLLSLFFLFSLLDLGLFVVDGLLVLSCLMINWICLVISGLLFLRKYLRIFFIFCVLVFFFIVGKVRMLYRVLFIYGRIFWFLCFKRLFKIRRIWEVFLIYFFFFLERR